MAATDTQSERIAPESANPEREATGNNLAANIIGNLIIVGAFASFAVALVGFLIGHFATLMVGAILLAIVAFVWAVAAAAALYKSAVSFSTRRRIPHHQKRSE